MVQRKYCGSEEAKKAQVVTCSRVSENDKQGGIVATVARTGTTGIIKGQDASFLIPGLTAQFSFLIVFSQPLPLISTYSLHKYLHSLSPHSFLPSLFPPKKNNSEKKKTMALKKSEETAEYSDQFIPLFDTTPAAKPTFIDLSRPTLPTLYDTLCNDFFNHTRCPTDFAIERIQILSNTVTWNRYQTEKRLRRRREYEKQLVFCAAVDTMMRNGSATTYVGASALASTGVIPVSDILNTTLPTHSMEAKLLFKDELLFHGTRKANLPSILTNGLDPRLSHRRNYGAGCYFSDSIEKCMQYVDRQTEIEQEYVVLVCAVLLGRVLVEPEDRKARVLKSSSFFLPDDYDSAVETDFWKEWIV